MIAITYTEYGPPDILQLTDITRPTPKGDEVLIGIRAASVNPLDWHILRGKPFLVRLMGFGFIRPKPKYQILGADIAGRVEAVGRNVTQFKVGDEVFGSGMGGFAEYACFRESKLALKPAAMTFEQAAAVPVAALTALQGLRDHGRIQSGQHVLINGASGGVGTFAVQIAKALGAQVTGVCSGRNLEMVRSIGADLVIDYTKEDFWQRTKKYDLILDNNAGRSLLKPLRALNSTGTYVFVGGSAFVLPMLQQLILKPFYSKKNGKRNLGMMANVNQADLAFIKELFEAGKVVPVIDRHYSLSEVPDAIRYLEAGHARGKVIISM
jgi:NADPH:quinone reductase-like Zn-dependent oxidoreductase